MKKSSVYPAFYLTVSFLFGVFCQGFPLAAIETELSNKSFKLEVSVNSGSINIKITDLIQNVVWADGPYRYELGEMVSGQLREYSGLELPKIERQSDRIRIQGLIGGCEMQHDLILSAGSVFLAEEMKITNSRGARRNVTHFQASFSKRVAGANGKVLAEFAQDHFQGIPFLHRSDYPKSNSEKPDKNDHDYSMQQIIEGKGFVFQTSEFTWEAPRRLPSRSFISDAWGWRHGKTSLGIFSFNQDNMIFSSLSHNQDGWLNFGGFRKEGVCLSIMERFEALGTIYLGLNRYYPVSEGYNQIAYQYRDMLDEMGCRFPENFNPPVHWNELYSLGWQDNRKAFYTRENLRKEANKAAEHSCQALYFDPGWDTRFGSFLWGEEWLGDCKEYVGMIEKDFGLKTSLHTPMPPWASNFGNDVSDWPDSVRRLIKVKDSLTGRVSVVPAKAGPQICMGSKQFMDEAEKRLLKLCEAGVVYFMYDGTWWNGPCEDTSHGHPVPYLYEDHIDACIETARRVHLKYPDVLIEMHDMINGGHWTRSTPVYYKYGLSGSYDENWGFELMWEPFQHLKDKTALAMYYYNLGCNVPIYLHVNTGRDNASNIILWWYASTARHLGIGGDSPDSVVTENHHRNMKLYIQLQDFFKRGEFYGINEEIHIHALPEKQECVINIFNLADSVAVTEGSTSLDEIGLNPNRKYRSDNDWAKIIHGKLVVKKEMKPWDADLTVIRPLK